jgi:hypothetical protein
LLSIFASVRTFPLEYSPLASSDSTDATEGTKNA